MFVLARPWVKVELFTILRAHAGDALSLVERRRVLLIVSRPRSLVLHLLLPDFFPLGLRDSHSGSGLLRLRLAHVVLGRAWVIIALWLVLAAHVDALGGFAECVRLIYVVAGAWNRLLRVVLPEVATLRLADSYGALGSAKHLGCILVLTWSRVHVDIWLVLATHVGRPTFGVFEGAGVDGIVSRAWQVLTGLIGPQILTLSLGYFRSRRLPFVLNRITIILAGAWIEIRLRLVLAAHSDALGSLAESVRLIGVVAGARNLTFDFFLPEVFSLSGADPCRARLYMGKTLPWLIVLSWTRVAVLDIFARRS